MRVNITDKQRYDEPITGVHHKNVEEADKPIILFVGFFFHITIALNEGWLIPRYLIYLRIHY